MDAAVDIGRNPVFSLSVENEQDDTRRDGQICLTKSISQARTGTRKSCSVDHGQDWQAHPVDLYSAIM